MKADKYAADLAIARAILRGEEEVWKCFAEEYSDRIYWTAYQWCRQGCRRISCPFSGSRALPLIDRVFRSSCDEIRDGYAFILAQIKKKVLPTYRGECSLASFIYRVLNPSPEGAQRGRRARYGYEQVYADYVRHRLGRLRLPKIIKRLPKAHQAVFEKMCWGWSEARICEQMGVAPEQIRDTEREIEKALLAKGWKYFWYWVGFRTVREVPLWAHSPEDSSEDDEREIAVADPSATPERAAGAHEIHLMLEEAIGRLESQDRDLLQLMYENGLSARQVGERLGIDPRSVYYRRDLALNRLLAELERAVPQCRSLGAKVFRGMLKLYLGDRPASP